MWTSRPLRRHALGCADDSVTPSPVAPRARSLGVSSAAHPSRGPARAVPARSRFPTRLFEPRTRAARNRLQRTNDRVGVGLAQCLQHAAGLVEGVHPQGMPNMSTRVRLATSELAGMTVISPQSKRVGEVNGTETLTPAP